LIEAETGAIVYGGTLCWSIAGGDNTSRRLLTAAGMGLRKISSNTNVGRGDVMFEFVLLSYALKIYRFVFWIDYLSFVGICKKIVVQ
jgi:hypothetical protein